MNSNMEARVIDPEYVAEPLRRCISELEAENRRMREALDLFWSQSLAIELLSRRAYGESSQIYQNVLAAILKAQEYYKNQPKDARAALSPRPVTPAGNIAGTLELKAEIAALRRERDDALRAAWAVRDLATPPVSDEDVERAVAEAKRVRQEIEGRGR